MRLFDGSYSRRSERRPLAALLAGAAMILAAALPAFAGGETPYVIIHKDGYRIDAAEKPEVEGDTVRIRLYRTGLLTTIPADKIDWQATEKYNAPKTEPAPEPAPEPRPAEAAPGKVIQKRIIGSKIRTALRQAEEEADTEGAGEPEEGASSNAKPADPAAAKAQAASARAARDRELNNLKAAHEGALKEKATLEQQIATLQAKVANEPGSSSVQTYKTASRTALERAQASLTSVEEKLRTLNDRIAELEFQNVISSVD